MAWTGMGTDEKLKSFKHALRTDRWTDKLTQAVLMMPERKYAKNKTHKAFETIDSFQTGDRKCSLNVSYALHWHHNCTLNNTTNTHSTYTGIRFPDEVFLYVSQIRGEAQAEPSDAAITTTLSGQANKNEYFSQEISVGTYGGGLAHLQAQTYTDTQQTLAARILHLPITDATIITSVSLCKCCQLLCSLISCTRFTIAA